MIKIKFNIRKIVLAGTFALGLNSCGDYDFNKINKLDRQTEQTHDIKLYYRVVKSMKDNQIQSARDLVETTSENNDLYNFISNNRIQAARNYIKYMGL